MLQQKEKDGIQGLYIGQHLTSNLKDVLQEFAIHQANEHKGLEQVLENHQDERVRNLIPKLARR